MNRFLYHAAFVAGLAALGWIGAGYVGHQVLAVAMTLLVAAFYVLGAVELHGYGQATGTLTSASATVPDPLPALAPWLGQIHPSLQDPVRQRVEGEHAALPGPALTPYLVGLLVLLGMLGTFLGMVHTLNGTGAALESATDVQAVRATLAAPVKGLGLAFGTSVAGIAASAMLGLMSALRRRERLQAAQALDHAIATTALRAFSLAHQREESLRLLQAQATLLPTLLPALADRLHTLMDRLDQQGKDLTRQLVDTQAQLTRDTRDTYTGLAESVGQTLQHSLTAAARAAGDAIQPAVEATMAHITRETASLHQAVADGAQQQLEGLARKLDITTQQSVQAWQAAQAHWRDAQAEQDAQRLAHWQQALGDLGLTLRQQWQQASEHALAQQRQAGDALEQTALRITTQADARAHDMLEEVRRLTQAAAEAPRAAAEVIAEMRQRLSDSLTRDNASLEERTRLMDTLGTLLEAVNRASNEQRGTIDALMDSTAAALGRVGTHFAEQTESHTARLAEVAGQVNVSAVEVASLGDAFGAAVQQFSQTSGELAQQLRRVEAALSQSQQRTDEQFGYYVAQARELVDLSVLSQKQIIDELQRLSSHATRSGRQPAAEAA